MDFLELDFEKAKARHLLFKTSLKSILYGATLDDAPVVSHLECGLGKWIYDRALPRYGRFPKIIELEIAHREIHDVAAQLIALFHAGDVEAARAGYQRVEVVAARLIALLDDAKASIREGNYDSKYMHLPDDAATSYQELINLQETVRNLDRQIVDRQERLDAIQKESQANAERFRDTVIQAPVGMVILNGMDCIVEIANASYLELVDRRAEDFIGRSLFESLPEVTDIVRPILQEVIRSGVAFHGNEFEIILHRFGVDQLCYFNMVYQPRRESDGTVTGVIVVATEVTEQVRVKQSILSSENRFRNLVHQSQFAKAVFKGHDLEIVIANAAMLEIWGRSLDVVVGKKLLDVFPELIGQKFPDLLRNVLETGEIHRENEAYTLVKGEDGSEKYYYLDFQYAPMFEVDGTASGILASVNDVTEKVEARKQVSEVAERLELATEGTRLATWDLNLKTRKVVYSKRLTEIFGLLPDALVSHEDLRNSVHPEDRKNLVEPAFERALQTGDYFYEARLVHPDKSLHWVRTQGRIYFDENHRPDRMLGTMMDITSTKLAELALKTSEDKFRTLADSMPQLVWTGDASGVLNYFSQSMADFSGLSLDELHANGWFQLAHPEERDLVIRLWNKAVASGRNFQYEHRFRNRNGDYRWHRSSATPQLDADGSILMWVGTSTDIHDSKLFIDELELKVQQRTHELTVLNEELSKTNMELAQFAYVASHDLQEPLRKIQTFATRIIDTERDNLSVRGVDYFRRIQASSMRMQQLIVDLMEFSRASSVEKKFESVDLNALLKNVQEQLRESIDHTGAHIHTDNLPVLNAIPYQIEQLLTNLIANAIKFVPKGTVPDIKITSGLKSGSEIELPDADATRTYCYISVSDNGIGFDPQYKDRIFQVFQRLHNRQEYEGTGIGLAICKKIAENHEGVMEAIGRPGKGAVFSIYIPSSFVVKS